ncbi:MAG TPA: hypothetical protein V6C78_32210 [Crinalium sp.]|jgi:hypothetical protein
MEYQSKAIATANYSNKPILHPISLKELRELYQKTVEFIVRKTNSQSLEEWLNKRISELKNHADFICINSTLSRPQSDWIRRLLIFKTKSDINFIQDHFGDITNSSSTCLLGKPNFLVQHLSPNQL